MAEEEEFGEALELIGLVEGTVEDLKQHVRENDLEDEDIKEILEAEKNAKDRKTAKRFLKRQLDETQGIDASDEESDGIEPEKVDREELLEILGGNVDEMKSYVREKEPTDEQLQEILHAERIVNDRKTAVKFLKSYGKKSELKEDIQKAEHDFQELREDLDRIEQEVMDEDIELDGIDLGDEETEEEQHPGDEDEAEEEDTEEDDTETANGGENEEETGDETEKEAEEDESELEKKKEIAESLEVDLSEEQLQDISLDELEAIKDEKEVREELIDELSSEFDEEKLRDASTADLRKLKDNLDDHEGESKESDDEKEEPEKDDDEIREEAQEDLEMLMGAVKSESSDEEDSGERFEGIKDLRSSIKEKLSFGSDKEESESEEIEEEEMMELLGEYQELEKYEAAIKTAHIMKGYLEYSEGIDREMTYKELAEEIEPESEEMEELLSFFKDMNTEQYTGNVTADMDSVIDTARTVVKQRS